MVAHGGTSVAGSFIQTLTMVDVATGWTECLPLVNRGGSLVVEALKRAQSLFPWLLRTGEWPPYDGLIQLTLASGEGYHHGIAYDCNLS
jgi:hypothetical protein